MFLYLTLRKVDFAATWVYLQNANLIWVAVALLVYSLAFVIRSFRWRVLLMPLGKFSAFRLFHYLILGFFMNDLLPLRLGELVRAHATGQKLSISRSSVLATVVIERIFDGLSYVSLFLITIIFLPFPVWVRHSFMAGSCLFAGGLFILFMAARNVERARRVLDRLPLPLKWAPRIKGIFLNFLNGLQVCNRTRDLFFVFALSLAVWIVEASVFSVLSLAFGLDLTLFQSVLVMIIIGIGSILPTAPGYVGTVEFLGVSSLTFLGFARDRSFAFIITLHLIQLAAVFFWGIRGMIKEKITFTELMKIEKSSTI